MLAASRMHVLAQILHVRVVELIGHHTNNTFNFCLLPNQSSEEETPVNNEK